MVRASQQSLETTPTSKYALQVYIYNIRYNTQYTFIMRTYVPQV